MSILLIGTLDTKGREIAYCRDKIRALGSDALILDSGILGEPLDIQLSAQDISRADVARAAGATIDTLRAAGTRGAAVETMREGVRNVTVKLYEQGKIHGVLCLGGAEGAVLGAYAMQALPIGAPKVIVTPIASGRRHYGQLMGTKDIFVVHSVVDILGINPISRAVFDNACGAVVGMANSRLQIADSKSEMLSAIGYQPSAISQVCCDNDAWQYDARGDADQRNFGSARLRSDNLSFQRRRRSRNGRTRRTRHVRRRD